jgi:hypothetical protein
MSKNKTPAKKTSPKKGQPAEKEATQEVQNPAAKADKPDQKAKHKGEALDKAREAFKALGIEAPKAFDAIEKGNASEADYKNLKAATDTLSKAVNALGLHVPKAAKG